MNFGMPISSAIILHYFTHNLLVGGATKMFYLPLNYGKQRMPQKRPCETCWFAFKVLFMKTVHTRYIIFSLLIINDINPDDAEII